MYINEEQLKAIQNACNEVDYGSVTIKINKESKTFDLVIEKQIRMEKEITKPKRVITVDKKYN